MKWDTLLQAVKAEGYTGADTDAPAVAKFVEAKNLRIVHQGKAVDIAELFRASTAKQIDISEAKVAELESEVERLKSRSRGAAAVHTATVEEAPGRFFIGNSARKSYDQKAKSGRDYAGEKKTAFSSSDEAELFGAWWKSATLPGLLRAEERELLKKTALTTVATAGGSTVPDIFIPSLIELKETRGAARQVLEVNTVGSDVVQFPRRTGGVTVYWPGEGGSITASDPSTNMVQVTANKMTAFTYVSNELLNDSAINFGDFVAREHAYAMADKEDQAVFNGDGTSTYGGHQGFRSKLATAATLAHNAGIVSGSGNSFSTLALVDFEAMVGRLPSYADTASPVWVMHKEFYWNVAAKLALAAGGVTKTEILDGISRPLYLGYPVVFSQVMPRISASGLVCALYGAFNLAAKAIQVGGGLQIASDTSVGFASDTTAFRGTNRFGITVHDVGNNDATEANRVPGPVVGLATT